VALKGLIAGQGLASEAKSFLQASQGRLMVGSCRLRAQNPGETCLDEVFEGGFPLGGGNLGTMEKVVGEVNGRLHGQ